MWIYFCRLSSCFFFCGSHVFKVCDYWLVVVLFWSNPSSSWSHGTYIYIYKYTGDVGPGGLCGLRGLLAEGAVPGVFPVPEGRDSVSATATRHG